MRINKRNSVISALILLAATLPAAADLRGMYGLGARSASVAGADRAIGSDAFSLSTNPAAMSQSKKDLLSIGVLSTFPQFQKLDGVIYDNVELGDSTSRVGTIDPNMPSQTHLLLGYVSTVGNTGWSAGANISVPIDKFVDAKSINSYQPNYTLYDGNPQKLSIILGVSKELWEGFSVGLGGAIYYGVAANIVGRLNTAPQTSTFNVGAVPRPGFAPNIGVSYELSQHHTLGLSFVGARDYRMDSQLKTFIYPTYGAVPIELIGEASLFYDPGTLGIGYGGRWGNFDVYLAGDYEFWTPYNGSAFKAVFKTVAFNQTPVASAFKDTFVPRAGIAFPISHNTTLRFGYAYRPTPAPDPNTTPANILDSNRHIASLGATYDSGTWENFFPTPLILDLNVQGHFLQEKSVTKTDASGIGAPGYKIGGTVIQAGLQISMNF